MIEMATEQIKVAHILQGNLSLTWIFSKRRILHGIVALLGDGTKEEALWNL